MVAGGTSRVIVCRGALATERRLLTELDSLMSADLDELALPVRIIVPSRSLRRHLLQFMAKRFGAVAGVVIQTLFAFAREVVVSDGRTPPSEDAAFEILVRRLAAEDSRLHASLGILSEGYDSVLGAVRDLLDAGFDEANFDPVMECLDEVGSEVAPERVERSRTLIQLAADALAHAEAHGVGRSMNVLRSAEDVLRSRGSEVVPFRHLLVHGFADVTGIAADLIKAIVQVTGGTVLIDRPPDPARPDRTDLGVAFLSRIEETLSHLDRENDSDTGDPADVELSEAADAEAEVRWVAERIRGLLDRGLPAEEIGIVGRAMDARATSLRRHLRRLGVPFSGEGLTVAGARPRRGLDRLLEVLQRGESTEIDVWLEARGRHRGATELLLGFRVLGLLRLADVPGISATSVPPDGVRLPLELGEESDDGHGSGRRLGTGVLRDAETQAVRLLTELRRRPDEGSATLHGLATLRVLDALGWDRESVEYRAVRGAISELSTHVPEDFKLTAGEWLRLIADRLSQAGNARFGGLGAGVRVLTVTEARARTFKHLFVIGLQRGVFPRVGAEDPMLPEAVRMRLSAPVLPEMPVKGRSADEERYLFAQLVSSAPMVSLSWHLFGEKGTLTPSPFVERLRLRPDLPSPVPAPSLWPQEDRPGRPRTAYELSVLAGSPGAEFQPLLEVAVGEGRIDAGVAAPSVSADAVAAARSDILQVVEDEEGSAAPAVWFGFCGADEVSEEERVWVTSLERVGVCPWRAFVERRLGVQPMADPLIGMPRIDGLLVGKIVHAVLEVVVGREVGRYGELDQVLELPASTVPWPDREELGELIRTQARRVAAKAGLAPLGLAPLLGARAARVLARARDFEWSGGTLEGVQGAEVKGETRGEDLPHRVAFRADRVDVVDGSVVLVDYKVAKPVVTAKTEPTRGDNLRALVARGRLLQAAAYSQAAGAECGRGRYVYLKPGDWADEICQLTVDGDDEDTIKGFNEAVAVIETARGLGIAFPRVEEADGRSAGHCTHCSVAEACRKDDTTFRQHLVGWMSLPAASAQSPEVSAARALWWLGFDRPGDDA